MNQNKKPYYSLEFKQDAAKLVLSKGYSIIEAANSLGISESALRKWIRAEKGGNTINNGSPSNQLSLSEHEELLRLRKENTRLKMEREILKKASAFFAQEIL
jgi:transposase